MKRNRRRLENKHPGKGSRLDDGLALIRKKNHFLCSFCFLLLLLVQACNLMLVISLGCPL
ncbi:hypothetical protein HanIR_Chr03g0130021 [Helianthus annuus]|nr:hypothetical protein HanIR_Chr03g0130021 [Helianthus annuus]